MANFKHNAPVDDVVSIVADVEPLAKEQAVAASADADVQNGAATKRLGDVQDDGDDMISLLYQGISFGKSLCYMSCHELPI